MWFRYKRRRFYELASRIPAVPGLIPLVLMLQFSYNTSDLIFELIKKFSAYAFKNGGIIRLFTGPKLYVGITNPEDTEYILKYCLEKENIVNFLKSIVGNAAVFAPVSYWTPRRKILVPTFSLKIVYSFFDVITEQSNELVDILGSDKRIGTGQFSVWNYMSAFTLNSLTETALGVKVTGQRTDNPVIKAVLDIFHLLTHRMFHIWLWPDCIYKFTSQHADFKESVRILYKLTDEIIQKKRTELRDLDLEEYNNQASGSTRCFLEHLMLLSGKDSGLSDVELRDEISLLLLAGTDTSAVAICNTLKLLAMYPKVQEDIYIELMDVLGDSNRKLNRSDLKDLKYLNMVVKESLRLFPPVPIIVRKVCEETVLPSGVILPNNTAVIVFVWGVNRDPNYWGPDAHCFRPERYLSDEKSSLITTFSLGTRNCVGYQFALLVIKIALTTILRRYKIVGTEEPSAIPNLNSTFSIMLRDKENYQISLEKR
ncbi:unnamed protein product [Leptosia nina]|uniref:Cytochrome P450 n=1 Tax=Leptosia nina TaxID=320188 RepID=A0AAV1JE27_9NEOP